jgi:heavy metal sensor kinase
MNNRSIGFRLTVWYAAVVSLAFILFSLALRYTLARQLRSDLAESLLGQIRGFEEYLSIEDQDAGIRLAHEIDEFSRSMPWDHLLAVYDSHGQSVYRNRIGFDPLLAGRRYKGFGNTWRIHWMKRPYLVAERDVLLREGTFKVYLAISSEPVEHMLGRLTMLLIAIVPAFVLCGGLGGYWLSRRALSPVQRITEKARSIGVNNLSERLVVPETRDEIQQMAETWNGMLERLERAVAKISQFTADASHELRTPIAIIRFASEKALRRPRPEEEYRHTLRQIQSESERMTALVEDLLYLARADAETLPFCKQEVDLQEVVRTTYNDFAPIAAASAITLQQAIAPDVAPVLGSEAALRRMLRTLVDNAVKYTPHGGTVAMRLFHENGRALLIVSDTGIGIPEETQRQVFERFFRVDPSRNKDSGGFGLGLSIAQTIARQHGSSIELQSRSGGGSVFSIALTEVHTAAPLGLEEAGKVH